MPFSHALLTPTDQELQGMGVMVHFVAGALDPLAHRQRALTDAYNSYVQANGRGEQALDRVKFLKLILDKFADRKYSISDYGFRGDNLNAGHSPVSRHSAPRAINDLVLKSLTKKEE